MIIPYQTLNKYQPLCLHHSYAELYLLFSPNKGYPWYKIPFSPGNVGRTIASIAQNSLQSNNLTIPITTTINSPLFYSLLGFIFFSSSTNVNMEEHWTVLLSFCKWSSVIMAIFFGILSATCIMYYDMSKLKPRFPKNPLRRTFCWLFLSTLLGPCIVAHLAAFLVWGLTFMGVTMLLLLLLPVLFIFDVIFGPAFGPFDSSEESEFTKRSRELFGKLRDLPEYWEELAISFSIWLAGGFLECARCAARDQISAQTESIASSGER